VVVMAAKVVVVIAGAVVDFGQGLKEHPLHVAGAQTLLLLLYIALQIERVVPHKVATSAFSEVPANDKTLNVVIPANALSNPPDKFGLPSTTHVLRSGRLCQLNKDGVPAPSPPNDIDKAAFAILNVTKLLAGKMMLVGIPDICVLSSKRVTKLFAWPIVVGIGPLIVVPRAAKVVSSGAPENNEAGMGPVSFKPFSSSVVNAGLL